MRAVGIRELKNKLSQYLRLVEAGESMLVTDRGTVIAELGPPGPGTPSLAGDPGLDALVREGRAQPGAAHDPDLYCRRDPALSGTTAAELLDAERGEG